MFKIAVCDDDEKICNLLENYINDSCRILHIEAETESFISGKVLKRKLRERENYQIYFLDIELADDTGISVSDCIRNEIKDEAAQIVYVSGKDGYDRQLFAFRPFNFIEKPFDQNMVTATLEKYNRIYGKKNDIFHYKYGHDMYCARVSEILYFKSNGRKVKIVMQKSEDEFYGSLEEVCDKLKGQGMILTHKSYLVNYRYIRSFQGEQVIMVNGDVIPVARGRKEEIARMQLHFENGGFVHGV